MCHVWKRHNADGKENAGIKVAKECLLPCFNHWVDCHSGFNTALRAWGSSALFTFWSGFRFPPTTRTPSLGWVLWTIMVMFNKDGLRPIWGISNGNATGSTRLVHSVLNFTAKFEPPLIGWICMLTLTSKHALIERWQRKWRLLLALWLHEEFNWQTWAFSLKSSSICPLDLFCALSVLLSPTLPSWSPLVADLARCVLYVPWIGAFHSTLWVNAWVLTPES